jgi:hypothetical protein
MSIVLLSLLVACGPKKAPEAPEAPAAVETVAEVAPPPEITNADLTVKMTRANGSVVEGHVKRIERSTDIYGEEGWETGEKEIRFAGETDSEYRKMGWTDVKSVSMKVASMSDVSCVYDSNFTPWMYDCTLKMPTAVVTKDGKTYQADTLKKWRFVFDDDTEVEFWMKKHRAHQQDEKKVDLDTTNPENYDLYGVLQQRLRSERTGDVVVKVEFQ